MYAQTVYTKIGLTSLWKYIEDSNSKNRLYLNSASIPLCTLCRHNSNIVASFDSSKFFKNGKPIVPEFFYTHWDMTSNIHSQAVSSGLYQHRYLYDTQYFDIVARQL